MSHYDLPNGTLGELANAMDELGRVEQIVQSVANAAYEAGRNDAMRESEQEQT